MSVQERVARGTWWLDQVRPGWRDALELGRLDLAHGGHCVLGQVFSEEAAAYAAQADVRVLVRPQGAPHALRVAGLPGLAIGTRL